MLYDHSFHICYFVFLILRYYRSKIEARYLYGARECFIKELVVLLAVPTPNVLDQLASWSSNLDRELGVMILGIGLN